MSVTIPYGEKGEPEDLSSPNHCWGHSSFLPKAPTVHTYAEPSWWSCLESPPLSPTPCWAPSSSCILPTRARAASVQCCPLSRARAICTLLDPSVPSARADTLLPQTCTHPGPYLCNCYTWACAWDFCCTTAAANAHACWTHTQRCPGCDLLKWNNTVNSNTKACESTNLTKVNI